ncbi:lantibiotic dehydratase [Streptomyces sp. NPDC002643]
MRDAGPDDSRRPSADARPDHPCPDARLDHPRPDLRSDHPRPDAQPGHSRRHPGTDADVDGVREVSVRWTVAVEAVFAGARWPVAYGALVERVRRRLPDAPVGAVEGLVLELVALGMLLTDLPPSPGESDPLAHVVGRLAGVQAARGAADPRPGVPEASGEAGRLVEVAEALAAYAACPPGGGLAALRVAERRMGALAHSTHHLAVDTLLDADIALPHAVAEEARRAADLLWRLGPPVTAAVRPLAAYHRDFLERHGVDRAVPVSELLDPVGGLGAPAPQVSHLPQVPQVAVVSGPLSDRDRLLSALAHEANLRGVQEVVLSDRDLDVLTDDSGTPPASAEMVFQLLSPSEEALRDGDFTLVASPLTGTWPAGALWARFAHLMPDAARRLAGAAPLALTGTAAADRTVIPAQLCFRPLLARAGNVVRTPGWLEHTIAPGTFGEGPDARRLTLDDLAVVGAPDRLRLVSLRHDGREIAAGTFHMLDTARLAPPHVRLLQLLTLDGVRPLLGWDWGPARDWPQLPGVRHGRTVLCRARRLVRDPDVLGPEVLHGEAEFTQWYRALRAWQRRWRVPDHVEAGTGDHRLPLDLSRQTDAKLLREELRRDPDTALYDRPDLGGGDRGSGGAASPGSPGTAGPPSGSHRPSTGWLVGPRGSHVAEVSVPLLRHAAVGGTGPRAAARPPVLLRAAPPGDGLPGGPWLYAKLYCPGESQDTVLTRYLPDLLDALPPEVDRWFYVRYADPRPHLRLRLHGEPRSLTRDVLPTLHDLAADLRRQALADRLSLDTYEPETERYGGTAATLAAAERVFHADSVAALVQLRLLDSARPPVDPLLLAAAGRAHLGWHQVRGGPKERARSLLAVAPRDADHRVFRERRRETLRLVDPFGEFAALRDASWAAPLLEAWRARADAGADYRRVLANTWPGPAPERVPAESAVLASLLHMHHNRLAADPSLLPEGQVAALARGAVEAHLARRQAGRDHAT